MAPAPAAAAPITFSVAGSQTVLFDGNVEQTLIPGLTAEVDFNFLGFTTVGGNTEADFSVTVRNTTSAVGLSADVTAVAFDVEPDATDGSATGAVFDNFILDSSLPNQFGPVEVCVNNGNNNNCQAGTGNNGVTPGNSSSFDLTLIFSGIVTEITLDNFGVRYQDINGNGFNGDSGTGTGNPVPEPGSMMLLAAGAAAVAARRRRKALA